VKYKKWKVFISNRRATKQEEKIVEAQIEEDAYKLALRGHTKNWGVDYAEILDENSSKEVSKESIENG
jgi:hypothetical protein